MVSDGQGDSLGRDQKSGFCLVATLANNPNPTDCRWREPDALDLTGAYAETIGPGDNDIYTPNVDGQYIDVTNSLPPAGQSTKYELVQWVNADCRLSDTGPAHHTWAVTVEITNSNGSFDVSLPGDTPYWYSYYNGLSPAQQCLPKETVRPELSGGARVGGIVSVVPGSWLTRMATGFNNPFSYQWLRCNSAGWSCAPIPGALSANYAPMPADIGSTLRARVVGNFPGTGEQRTPQDSEPTQVVTGAPAAAPAPPAPPVTPASRTPGPSLVEPVPIVSLTALLRSARRISVDRLRRHGLRVRVHCSRACRMGLRLVGAGGVRLAGRASSISRHGNRTVTLHLGRRASRVVRHFRRGILTLWLHVKSRDHEQQTVSRVLRLRR